MQSAGNDEVSCRVDLGTLRSSFDQLDKENSAKKQKNPIKLTQPSAQSLSLCLEFGQSVELRALTTGQDYYFAIEAFNENDVSKVSKAVYFRQTSES